MCTNNKKERTKTKNKPQNSSYTISYVHKLTTKQPKKAKTQKKTTRTYPLNEVKYCPTSKTIIILLNHTFLF